MMIITYMSNGTLKTEVIENDELLWYLKNTTVYKVSNLN